MQPNNHNEERRNWQQRDADAGNTRAIELAAQAIGRLDDHQSECRDRYISLESKIDRLTGILSKAAGALILILLGAVGTLVLNLINHGAK